MRLIVDTSVLVGELLRSKGRERLGDDRLELFIAERMRAEVAVDLPRRISSFACARGLDSDIGEGLIDLCLLAVDSNLVVVDEAIYAALEDEGLARSRRDPNDWPAVACALALSASIWTSDNDFLGTGVATWTTETLRVWLDRNP